MNNTKKRIVYLSLLLLSAAHAEDAYKIGEWNVIKSTPGIQIANVTNDAGAAAGVVCIVDASCVAYLYVNSGCEKDGAYPMMINSPVGASGISTTCQPLPNEGKNTVDNMFVISDFGAARAAFESGGDVGFVLPLMNGQFRALRFSTKGATAAIKEAMTLPSRQEKPTKGSQTSDQLL